MCNIDSDADAEAVVTVIAILILRIIELKIREINRKKARRNHWSSKSRQLVADDRQPVGDQSLKSWQSVADKE